MTLNHAEISPSSSKQGSSNSIGTRLTRNTSRATIKQPFNKNAASTNTIKIQNNNGIHVNTVNQSKVSPTIVSNVASFQNATIEDDCDTKRCLWKNCTFTCKSDPNSNETFIEHIKTKHICSQKKSNTFRCLWFDCPVYNSTSSSYAWLERHVIDHVDKSPLACLFNGCNRKFRTESTLEKHIHSHLNTSQTGLNGSTNGGNDSQSPSPVKTRNRLLATAKLALHNLNQSEMAGGGNGAKTSLVPLKNEPKDFNATAAGSSGQANNGSTKYDFSQLFKTLTRKRKANAANDQLRRRFKKANYKDYFDPGSVRVVEDKLKKLNYKSGQLTLKAKIVASEINAQTGVEWYKVEWMPGNM